MSQPAPAQSPQTRVLLYGRHADELRPLFQQHPSLQLVADEPEVVVSYGGDGTLLAAEGAWPGLPKVPILNSRRGHRCIPHPPAQVIETMARGELVSNVYTKLACQVHVQGEPPREFEALNEFTIHMGFINSAVRWRMWLNEDPYDNGIEMLGDGFLVCTPFGSTAYFNKLTRGIFSKGIGIAFKATTEHTNHMVLPSDTSVRFQITRGPAVLAYDSAQEYSALQDGDELIISKHSRGAIILTCGPVRRLDEPF